MYCANCGEELPKGANFCPQCGTRLSRQTSNRQSDVFSFIRKYQWHVTLYVLWVIVHFNFFLFSEKYFEECFYPFDNQLINVVDGCGNFSFNVDAYDISEFFFYTILFPIIVWILVKCFLQLFQNKKTALICIFWTIMNIVLFCVSYNRDYLVRYVFGEYMYYISYNVTILLCCIVLAPAIIGGVMLLIKNSSFYKEKEIKIIKKSIKSFLRLSNTSEGKERNVSKKEKQNKLTPKERTFEAEMVTMPLFKRIVACLIDQIVILSMIAIISFFYAVAKSYDGMNFLVVSTMLLFSSPDNLYTQIDTSNTIIFVCGCLLYFGLAEYKLKSSVGKYWLKGIILDSDKKIIDEGIGKRLFTRLGLYVGFSAIFHFQLGLGYAYVLVLYAIIIGLPVIFTRQSLIDLMTGTICAKRK